MTVKSFSLEPFDVPAVDTPHRRILTRIPVPESLPILRKWYSAEPDAMGGMAPVIWDHARDFSIFDPYGNMWLDWTSGVLTANAGHNPPEVVEAIRQQADKLLFGYGHPTEIRARLAERLVEILPDGLDRVMLFSGGSEVIECAIKLSRMYARRLGGDRKHTIVSFDNAFHGRTLGSQLAGGIPAMKEWIGPLDPSFVQVPFPDGYCCKDTSFELFLRSLDKKNLAPADIASVIMETFQGGDVNFAPAEYVQSLAGWCRENDVVLIFDEIQAGFGRTGKLFGFEHYGVTPDMAGFAKGMSGSLPLTALAGSRAIMDGLPARSITTTYGANPVCAAAASANIELILKNDLPRRSAELGKLLHGFLSETEKSCNAIGFVHGRGLVAAVHFVDPNTGRPDAELAFRIVESCVRQGLMLFAPVGLGAASIKICPPLTITAAALEEGAQLFRAVIENEVRM